MLVYGAETWPATAASSAVSTLFNVSGFRQSEESNGRTQSAMTANKVWLSSHTLLPSRHFAGSEILCDCLSTLWLGFFATFNQPVVTGNVQEEDPSSGRMIITWNSWTRLEFCCPMQRPLLHTDPRGEGWRHSQHHSGIRIKQVSLIKPVLMRNTPKKSCPPTKEVTVLYRI